MKMTTPDPPGIEPLRRNHVSTLPVIKSIMSPTSAPHTAQARKTPAGTTQLCRPKAKVELWQLNVAGLFYSKSYCYSHVCFCSGSKAQFEVEVNSEKRYRRNKSNMYEQNLQTVENRKIVDQFER